MRQDQFEAAYILMSKSPIWGLGQKATLYFPDGILVGRLLGLESIWIWIMVERGILGIITYCIFILLYADWAGTRGENACSFSRWLS